MSLCTPAAPNGMLETGCCTIISYRKSVGTTPTSGFAASGLPSTARLSRTLAARTSVKVVRVTTQSSTPAEKQQVLRAPSPTVTQH